MKLSAYQYDVFDLSLRNSSGFLSGGSILSSKLKILYNLDFKVLRSTCSTYGGKAILMCYW